jgi:hypothetical protein
VHDGETEDENEEDDTLFQYCSEDEGRATTEVDSMKLHCWSCNFVQKNHYCLTLMCMTW